MPCRINRRRVWTHRIMLEATQHAVNSFWTLTYSDDSLPLTEGNLPTLVPSHLTDFMKRLRSDFYPQKLRYFNVGEYGDSTQRPHYHLALFGYPACERGRTQVKRSGNCCSMCDRVRGIWGFGLVYSGQLEANSAAYIAGYCTKKWTKEGEEILKGRKAEFARMSLRPGIGARFMPEVASALLTHSLDSTMSDVPTSLRTHARVQPLGRYLTRQLRQQIGRSADAPESTIQKAQEKLQPVREMAQATAPKGLFSVFFKEMIVQAHKGKHAQIDAKSKLYKKRGSL